MKFKFLFLLFFSTCLVLFKPNISEADLLSEFQPSASDYGGMGLFQTRNARFSRDGMMDFSRSYVAPYERWLINIQILPWWEGTFRYTSIDNRNFLGGNLIVGTTFKDRAIDFKFRLLKEDFFVPEVAIGFQDFLGTGLFSGEYIVASKRFGDLDFSFGLGWGYMAGSGQRNIGTPKGLRKKNPLISIANSFENRTAGSREGGSFAPGAWFSGPETSFFVGMEYFTPIKGLSFKIESDPHNYSREPVGNQLAHSSNLNWGVNYRAFNWIDFALARERGEEWMFRAGLRADLNDKGVPKLMDKPPKKLQLRKKSISRPAPEIGVDPLKSKKSTNDMQPWFYDRYRPDATSLQTSKIKKLLQEEGINFSAVEYNKKTLFVDMLSNYDTRSVAQILYSHSELELNYILIKNKNTIEKYDINDLRETSAIDNLFLQLNRSGWQVSEVKIDKDIMLLFVLPALGNFPVRTIEESFLILPPGINRLRIITTINNQSKDITSLIVSSNPKNSDLGKSLAKSDDILSSKNLDADQNDRYSKKIYNELVSVFTGSASLRSLFSKDIPYKWSNSIVSENIINKLKKDNIKIKKILFQNKKITVHIFRGKYRTIPKNLGRVLRVVSENIDEDIEYITLVLESQAGEIVRFTINREQFERATVSLGSAQEIWHTTQIEPPQSSWAKDGEIYNNTLFPDIRYSVRPGLMQHVGGGDQFFLHELFGNVATKISFADGFDLDAAFAIDLYNNFNRITVPSDSRLPPVRSDIKNYLQRGNTTIRKLRLNYMFSPFSSIYTRLTAGYFEFMYGGFGAEVLYNPFGKRYAYGIDINYARKRNFDQLWGFQDYSVMTGHLNFYYHLPFYNLNTVTHIGRYLAGDDGVTQILYRRFKSGISAGVWATLTNIPFKTFGEGSFDKGFFLNVPIDLFSTRENIYHGVFGFRPLTKDGGQMLDLKKLYDHVVFFPDEINRDWKYVLE